MTEGSPVARGRNLALDAVVGVAVDHRDSFRAALAERGVPDAGDSLIADIKLDVCRALGPGATLLLVDPLVLDALPEDERLAAPFAMPLEAQGYGALHEVARTELLAHPTAAEMATTGAVAAKLLLPFRVDHPERAAVQEAVAREAVVACHAAGLPLVLEPIAWLAPGEQVDDERYSELVAAGAARLALLEPGVLKLQYPARGAHADRRGEHPDPRGACEALHAACAGHPWVLLGGGAPLDELEEQVVHACAAGARGAIVGRSLFAGALDPDADRRRAWLAEVARPALARIAHAVRRHS